MDKKVYIVDKKKYIVVFEVLDKNSLYFQIEIFL